MNCVGIIILVSVLCIIIYFVIYTTKKENFTSLVGPSKPLTTYDDYGTFNFIFHMDDLPYYNPTYEDLGDDFKNYSDGAKNFKYGGIFEKIIPKDSFINYDGKKVRRELVAE